MSKIDEKPRRNGELPRFDQDLRRAKNNGSQIAVTMDAPLELDAEDITIRGSVLEVDTYALKIQPLNTEGVTEGVWLSKSHIVAVSVLSSE